MRIRHWLLGGTAGSTWTDAGLAVLRVPTGLLLAFLHGINKIPPSEGFVGRVGQLGFPAPDLFAWIAGLAEFGGGILIALGLLTRPVALLLVAHFAVVVLMAHAGDTLDGRELPILFWAIAGALALTGPGRFSLDGLIGRRTGPRR